MPNQFFIDSGMRRRRIPHVRAVIAAACVATTALAVGGCRDLTSLQQSNPGALDAAGVFIPANAVLLTNGVIADFECAFSRYVVGTGLFVDELSDAISNTTNFDYDARRVLTNSTYGTGTCGSNQQPPIYTTLSTARASGGAAGAQDAESYDVRRSRARVRQRT